MASLQQLYGHGGNFFESWAGGEPALYTDWAIIVLIPIIFFAYSHDVFRKN
ncbi:MAG: hypothetical protein ACI9FR_002000 [Cryomorphaceae bacterium]|jgi:hypothetical protein